MSGPADIRDQLQATLGGSYKLDRELGGGGMSRVFLAEETALGRRVVVKVLPPEMAAAVSIDRFKREIALAARLQHPHIVPLLAAGEVNGVPYFTMPFVEGESLRVRLARYGELPVAEGMRLLREVASALSYAHGRGVVHRDIKPDNVLLSGGSAMVTDFGVAKALSASSNAEHSGMTSLGVALGTPAYMAPEQASADPALDHRADIYAFGILAYETLTGQTPFSGRTPQGLLAAHVAEIPENVTRRRVNLPPALAALIMRCLEKRPADRPQTAQEVLHALDDITTPSGGMEPTSGLAAIALRPERRRMRTVASWGKKPLIIGLGIAGIAVAAVATSEMLGPADFISANGGVPRSIAVLQLANASPDTSMRFFAAGMTDELTTALAKIPGLRVASRNATDALQSSDIRTAGSALGVGAVLEGRMRRDGDQMALTVQLTNVADGLSLWSGSYRAQVKDAFAVQDSIARAIAGALKVALTPALQAGVVRRETESGKAHDLYLRGRYVQSEYTEAALRRSIQFFEQAIAEDSSYAAPWSGIADSWSMIADDWAPPREVMPKVRHAIERGLAIDPDNPALRNTIAIDAFWYERDLPKALREFDIALRADSTVVDGNFYYALALAVDGQLDSARAIARRMAADKTEPETVWRGASAALFFGDTALARSICETPAMRDHSRCRVTLMIQDGKLDEALAHYRDAANRAADNPRVRIRMQTSIADMLWKMNRKDEALKVANALEKEAQTRYVREDLMAEMWARLDDPERTLAWLNRAKASNSAGLAAMYAAFATLPVRKDPKVAAFIRANAVGKPLPGW